MKAESLRIGNYYKWYADGKYYYFKVDNAFFMDINVINNSEPIELTEEILLKCGFDSDGLLYEFRSAKYVLKSDFEYVWIYDVELKSCICVKCKYLHQLQNLYGCLTNEELTINL